MCDRFDRNIAETRCRQIGPNSTEVVIAMRRAGQELRRLVRKDLAKSLLHDLGKVVFLDLVPHVEEEASTGLKYTARLRISFVLVGEEHHAELAGENVEACVDEGQSEGASLVPFELGFAAGARP